ncbi:hypothetical protein Peur_062931 [Populus x canadensis]
MSKRESKRANMLFMFQSEAETNLARNALPGVAETYEVQGRGGLQLGILIENMRHEGLELSVSPPRVNEEHVGLVMEALSHRRSEVLDMGPVPGHVGRTRLSFTGQL